MRVVIMRVVVGVEQPKGFPQRRGLAEDQPNPNVAVGKPKANPNVTVAFGAATPHSGERPVHTARIGGAGVHTARIGGAGVRVGGGRRRGGSGDGGIERN
jgi:hypothetical protein